MIHEYQSGRLPLFHLDLYRLETPDQVFTAGLEEYLPAPNGITVVEWIEHWFGANPGPPAVAMLPVRLSGPLRWVWIEARGETERIITYEDFGA